MHVDIHTQTYIMYGLKSSASWGQSFSHCGPLGKILNWFQLLWLHLRSDASRKEAEWLNSTGQQVMHDTGVFPDCSTWKGLTSMNSSRATSVCWFQNRLDRQNTFKLHTHTNSFCVIFDFFEVQSSLQVRETSHTDFKWSFFLGAEKKKQTTKKETPEYSSLLVYYSTETNTFYKMKAILKNSLKEITATQGSYYLYSQLHQSLIFIVTVLFLFWCYKNVPCGFSLNNKCATLKLLGKKDSCRSVLQIKAKESL